MTAEWATFWVIVATLLILVWQVNETRRAANATRDSILQADKHIRIVHKQWVDVSNWSCSEVPSETLITLKVGLMVTNNTPLPLTLTSVRAFFDDAWLTARMDALLGRGSTSLVYFDAGLTDRQKAGFLGQKMKAVIVGQAGFNDAFGDPQTQFFGQICEMKKDQIPRFAPYVGSVSQGWNRMEGRMTKEAKQQREAAEQSQTNES